MVRLFRHNGDMLTLLKSLPGNALPIFKQFVTAREGRFNKAYRDTRGIWTNGIGNIHNVVPGSTISDAQVDADFAFNTGWVVTGYLAHVTYALNENQCAAILDFIFNEGITHFVTSALLHDINNGDLGAVPTQLLRWDFSAGVEVNGLENRRKLEIALWKTPVTVEAQAPAPVADPDDGVSC